MRYTAAQALRAFVALGVLELGLYMTTGGGAGGFFLWPLAVLWFVKVKPPTDRELDAYHAELERYQLSAAAPESEATRP